MLTEEMKKAIEEVVDTALSQMTEVTEEASTEEETVAKSEEATTEEVVTEEAKVEETLEKSEEEATEEKAEEDLEKGKGMPKESTPENGGKDELKSGTPKTEKQKMMKSIEELSEHLAEDELALIQAWRDDQGEIVEEPVQKSMTSDEDMIEKITKAVSSQVEDLKKAISGKDEIIKSLQDKVEKMAAQPAYDKRSVDSLEALEKSGESKAETLSKSQILDTMLELQLAGKGINSRHIAEYEAVESLSDPIAAKIVKEACKTK